jgi:pyruvate dehydrogenase (quinone)
MSRKVADTIVEVLEAAGVKHCYGIVGDTLNRIASAIERSAIEFVHMRHEEAGAFAAQAESLLTGDLTAVAGSCGPGSLHFINGLYEANRNHAPVVLIASQVSREEIGFDFIQEVNFAEVYKECSVFCEMILTPDQARRKTAMACQAAIAKRGVAVLIVPVDISKSDDTEGLLFSVSVSRSVTRPVDSELDRVAQMLNTGGRIAIYGGAGCEGAHAEVLEVASRLQAPIIHTSRAKDILEPNNPHNIGMTGLLGGEAGYHAIFECDTLLLLGVDFAWSQFYPSKARIVQVDIDPTHLGRRHPITLGVTGDVKATLEALLPRLEQREDSAFHDEFVARHIDSVAKTKAKASRGRDGRISPFYLTALINQFAAEDALFTLDDGTPIPWALRYIECNGKRRIFCSLLHGTMAGAMPSALGLQKCSPGRQVISLCGDGGLAMGIGDLMTAVQEDLPIKIVVFDNAKLGFVEIEQNAEGMLSLYTDLKNPDFGKVAEAMGLWGRSVSADTELEGAIQELLAQPGPALLNVHVLPMTLVIPPVADPKAAVGMALWTARSILQGRSRDVIELVKDNLM